MPTAQDVHILPPGTVQPTHGLLQLTLAPLLTLKLKLSKYRPCREDPLTKPLFNLETAEVAQEREPLHGIEIAKVKVEVLGSKPVAKIELNVVSEAPLI